MMQFDAHKIIDAPPNRVFPLLMDPAVLIESMPGLKTMQEQSPGIYAVEMELGIPGFKGQYRGEMRLDQVVVPHRYHLLLEGQGPNGDIFMSLDVRLTSSHEGQTDLHYQGEGIFGDQSNSLTQKVLSGVGNVILGQFFNAIAKRARKMPH
ncbi:SRPBCC domain-containing protein [Sulfobacillus thermosulfidooxidans]|uniref:SRPBCC domain-containing protein n=1 Tax=Sulfobacillus thermosulfidooxidans TaxID=28034 RepID=UPI0002DCB42F|nr:SRPBCC domain-containing protein [Sulfobacillus thermosulfidooxidans]